MEQTRPVARLLHSTPEYANGRMRFMIGLRPTHLRILALLAVVRAKVGQVRSTAAVARKLSGHAAACTLRLLPSFRLHEQIALCRRRRRLGGALRCQHLEQHLLRFRHTVPRR